jgi:HEPN domain-containing protein
MRDLFYGVSEQGKAGKHRMVDAQVLLNAGRWRGAMYMAGYSVECLLKTRLMRMFDCRHLQELDDELQGKGILPVQATVFTHQLESLLRLTGASERLRQNEAHWRLFNKVNRWIPAWRYTADPSNPDDANDFLEAVEKVSLWIENNT